MRRRWLGHACIITRLKLDTMHEAALGEPLCSARRLFLRLGAPGCRAVLDRTSGMQTLPQVWRHERFIVSCALVGDPVDIWIASGQIAVRVTLNQLR
jgi:hypothetical protein